MHVRTLDEDKFVKVVETVVHMVCILFSSVLASTFSYFFSNISGVFMKYSTNTLYFS